MVICDQPGLGRGGGLPALDSQLGPWSHSSLSPLPCGINETRDRPAAASIDKVKTYWLLGTAGGQVASPL